MKDRSEIRSPSNLLADAIELCRPVRPARGTSRDDARKMGY